MRFRARPTKRRCRLRRRSKRAEKVCKRESVSTVSVNQEISTVEAARKSHHTWQGQMLNHIEQLQELQAHAEKKFCQRHDYFPGEKLRQEVLIDEGKLQVALAQLPARKAAPPGAVEVANKVKPVLDALWRKNMAGTVPPIWRDTDLAWLPKPPKNTSRPENLRPIGLIHPLSKAITTVLRLEIRPMLEAHWRSCRICLLTRQIHSRCIVEDSWTWVPGGATTCQTQQEHLCTQSWAEAMSLRRWNILFTGPYRGIRLSATEAACSEFVPPWNQS